MLSGIPLQLPLIVDCGATDLDLRHNKENNYLGNNEDNNYLCIISYLFKTHAHLTPLIQKVGNKNRLLKFRDCY